MWYTLVDTATLWTVAVTQFAPDVNDGQELLSWPEGVDPIGSFYEPFRDPETGVISLVENSQKKLDAQWASVRAQQKELLYKSDWTCSVTDYEVPNKSGEGALLPTGRSLWVQYRQALRDVTLQSDPFEIVWPVAPEA